MKTYKATITYTFNSKADQSVRMTPGHGEFYAENKEEAKEKAMETIKDSWVSLNTFLSENLKIKEGTA